MSHLIQPFSSNTRQEKEQLQNEVDNYRTKLNAQFQELQANAQTYGKHALILGGVIAGVYLAMEALLPHEDDEESDQETIPPNFTPPAQPGSENDFSVGKALRGLAWTLAVGWARQQLTHYLEAEKKTDAQYE